MRYIISDLHGCFGQYKAMLGKIGFSDGDTLYVLGDVCDRGPDPMAIFLDMTARPNVRYILGNHDYDASMFLRKMAGAESGEECFSGSELSAYMQWLDEGGRPTAEGFLALGREDRGAVLACIENAPLYETIDCGGRHYILVHSGLGGFRPDRPLSDYSREELTECRADYSKRYFDEDTFLVTGHTPGMKIPGWNRPEIYRRNGHIAVDCGCWRTGVLGAYCVESGEVIYVK
ncbi:MAG: metallophosphoesterase [Anaerovoracaceae bacterium]|jgi:serine/threonine protein phosphatase 1